MIMEICRSLCLHCRHERIGELPNEDVCAGIQDQLAISRLSRCSNRLRVTAQPILFHFFAYLEARVAARRWEAQVAIQKREAAFIRTLFWRPDLASSVRSLVLWSPTEDWWGEARKSFALEDQDQTFKRIAKRLGPQWEGRQYDKPFEFHELAIALAPRASYVMLNCYFGLNLSVPSPSQTWENWPQRLENLKHLVLVDREISSDYCYLRDFMALIKHTPNLESLVVESLVVAGCHDGDRDNWEDLWSSSDEFLSRLKKLSVRGFMRGPYRTFIPCSVVEVMIRHSPVLEDLEFFHPWEPIHLHGKSDLERFDLDVYLGTAKTTLKRLCYSAFCFGRVRIYWRGEDEEDLDVFYPNADTRPQFTTGMSLHDFTALEALELEQPVLYGQVFDNPDRSRELLSISEFLGKLPPLLKHFRLGFVFSWPIVFRDLMALADEHGTRFPQLRSVTLDLNERPQQKEHDILLQTYQLAGISLTMQYTVWGGRGLLPTRPAGYPAPKPTPISYEEETRV
ncbi:hypothetical protein QBC37DRAFT_484385 [Rhypophila decipiens]|uniref:F-box domain-containing protein n=1 Tax=Rhypophila decipiens TaxID=261697 RepID=A0AAN6Y4M4_9PEZI|nr:hypothetical protein QBC37DRAFT_484385 [Rhypophila decipiens]